MNHNRHLVEIIVKLIKINVVLSKDLSYTLFGLMSVLPAGRINKMSDGVVRVFVSSTFRDMRRERDVMMGSVFPQVRRWCEKRGVIWREIDLRWGITMEEANRGEALRLCLEEVRTCFPFFIALLGERYGYIENELPAGLEERFPWLQGFRDRSITEIEIEAGALRHAAPSQTVLFYFRDPKFLEGLPETEDPADYRPATEEGKDKLGKLKARIVASGHTIRRFSSAEELEEIMTADLLEMLSKADLLIHSHRVPDAQWNFARTHGQFFVGAKSWLHSIDQHVMASGVPLLISGEVGSGKTALIAAWALGQTGGDQKIVLDSEPWWRRIIGLGTRLTSGEYHSNERTNVRIIPWFVGAVEEREDWRGVAQGLVSMIDPGQAQKRPDKDPLSLRSRLSAILHNLEQRTVLIIDGVDKIRDFDKDAPVSWIPDSLPPHVRLIVSAHHPAVIEWARRHNWKTLRLAKWSTARRLNFTVSWLESFGRKLDPAILNEIVTAPQTGEPLYLSTLLEELRMFGSFEELPNRVSKALCANSAKELYGQMLIRLESGCGPSRVRDFFSFMQVSRRGLTESELAILLGSGKRPLPSAYLSTLLLAAREALACTRGRLRAERAELRDAVAARYLAAGDNAWRERLVEHFMEEPWSRRKLEELPWQLAALARWNALARLVADPGFLSAPGGLVEARWAWSWLIANASAFRPETIYADVINDPGGHPQTAGATGWLLKEMGRTAAALSLGEYQLAEARRAAEPEVLAEALEFQVELLSSMGRCAHALSLWIELGSLARERRHPFLEARSLAGRGKELRQLGRVSEAREAWRAEERLLRQIGDQAALSACIANLALLDYDRDPNFAFTCLHRHMETCRLTDDLNGLRLCLGNLGALCNVRSKPSDALVYLREEESICRQYRDDEALHLCLGNQAESQKLLANYDAALDLLEERVRICRELGNHLEEAHAMLQRAHLFGEDLRAIDAAVQCLRDCLLIARTFSLDQIEADAGALSTRLGLPGL